MNEQKRTIEEIADDRERLAREGRALAHFLRSFDHHPDQIRELTLQAAADLERQAQENEDLALRLRTETDTDVYVEV